MLIGYIIITYKQTLHLENGLEYNFFLRNIHKKAVSKSLSTVQASNFITSICRLKINNTQSFM